MKNNKIILILLNAVLLIWGTSCSSSEPDTPILTVESPAGENSSLPRLYTDNTGTTFMSWVEESEGNAELKYSVYSEGNWTTPKTIASDSNWFVNWADFPSLIARNGEPMAAHWLQKKAGGTYSYDINMAAFSTNWEDVITPHGDNTATEHGFVSMIPVSDTTFFAAWLDGRETAGREHDAYSDLSQAMTLRAAMLDKDAQLMEEYLIDESVCDCCNTALTQTDKGLVVAYRNRTDEEIRDIYVSSYADGSWSEPKAVHNDNWQIAACPVNGPAIDASGKTVAVAWFTGAGDVPKVQLALSDDYGSNFDQIIELDSVNTSGRVDLDISDEIIWVSWLGDSADQAVLQIRSFTLNGELLEEYGLPSVESKRSGGFPQITPFESGLLIANTDLNEDGSKVRTYVLKTQK